MDRKSRRQGDLLCCGWWLSRSTSRTPVSFFLSVVLARCLGPLVSKPLSCQHGPVHAAIALILSRSAIHVKTSRLSVLSHPICPFFTPFFFETLFCYLCWVSFLFLPAMLDFLTRLQLFLSRKLGTTRTRMSRFFCKDALMCFQIWASTRVPLCPSLQSGKGRARLRVI